MVKILERDEYLAKIDIFNKKIQIKFKKFPIKNVLEFLYDLDYFLQECETEKVELYFYFPKRSILKENFLSLSSLSYYGQIFLTKRIIITENYVQKMIEKSLINKKGIMNAPN